jgi:hypothetical protein
MYIMNTFQELLQTEGYDWASYFYRLESKPNRTFLEETLLRSYYRTVPPIDMCCCDTTPIKHCGPECCTQVTCFHCMCVLRICKDAWFCYDNVVLCIRCKTP